MKSDIIGMLKNMEKGYYKIIQCRKDGGFRTLKNDKNHLHTFISKIRKNDLKEYETLEESKIVFNFFDDSVNDRWEVIPSIKLIRYQIRGQKRRTVANDLVDKELGVSLLTQVGQAQKIEGTDIIEVVNNFDTGYLEYILKDKLEQKISRIDLANKAVAKVV
ncbi:hypothetical protein BX659_13144 [Orenia metallireducens]|jgi:hypothetical protein|uniref:Uncharacterized protein n=1 Tax=Orenia metallireducens TaxID=1413210 RepID=A0A285I961_9FIRM|nr:hypothetical protein [Orenia metallireducens]PRX21702.1 hypothetical protein BX659_13144 [Orenia metallireducens]SNY44519.1 hypothetical protein SAMN06265827_13444 [Orenia metallireducens]